MSDPILTERDAIMQKVEDLISSVTLPLRSAGGDDAVVNPDAPKVFVTCSRKFRHWKDVKPMEKPAVFLTKPVETHERSGAGLPDKAILECFAYIYTAVDVKDGTAIPDATMNVPMQAIEQAMGPDDPLSNRNTLGGLVHDCRIESELKNDAGDLDGEGVARVPIRIIIP